MRKVITAALAAASLVGGSLAATEASARDRRGDTAAAAIAGFALGAALGGNGHVYVGQPYYGRGYYPRAGYYSPYHRSYYGRGYHRGYDRPYHRRCWTERLWDPYYGRVHRRVCR
jgi:hypothetical protein